MIKVGLIGLGYWGPNLARVLNQSQKCDFAACCDLDAKSLEKMTRQYPRVKGFQNPDELLASDVDAVVIATPISTHYALARQALECGKHVLVEKPLTDRSDEADELAALADKFRRILMTGHTFLFSPPVVKVKELMDSGDIGDLLYLSFSRVNLGLYRKDVDVVWDLAVHDISILLYWVSDFPVRASSFGRSCIQQQRNNDVAFLWLEFASGLAVALTTRASSMQKSIRLLRYAVP